MLIISSFQIKTESIWNDQQLQTASKWCDCAQVMCKNEFPSILENSKHFTVRIFVNFSAMAVASESSLRA